jgi:ABC-type phosphate transport system ATPase subunit
MGHFTVLGDTIDEAHKDALAIRKALGMVQTSAAVLFSSVAQNALA